MLPCGPFSKYEVSVNIKDGRYPSQSPRILQSEQSSSNFDYRGSRMVALNKFFSSVLLAVLYTSRGNAASWPTNAKHATHRVRSLDKGVQVESFHPQTDYKTFGAGKDIPPSFANADIEDKAVSFVTSELNLDSAKVSFKSGYTQDGQSFGYLKQMHDGIPFVNAVANVAFKDTKAVAFGQSFVDTSKIADSKPSIDVNSVIPKIEEVLEGKVNEIPPSLEYIVLQDGSVALAHVFQLQNDDAGSWYEAYVDAHSGDLVSVTDFVSDASYRVLPIQKEIITEGLELLTDPQNTASSPNGWHSDGMVQSTATTGNNVVAYIVSSNLTTPQSATGLVFDYTYDTTKDPIDVNNIKASVTNAFYLVNSYHDTLYQYGFTESAFNFQENNFGKGGSGRDKIRISVQDPSGTNNANFATPPDGQPGMCRMFIWTKTITLEAGGMGEGWSDAVADWFHHSGSAGITDFVLGQYVTNNEAGFRSHPYSTSATTNPLRYSDIAKLNEVHNIGEVWANILHNVYAALVNAHGWSATAKTSASGTEGNIVFLQLLVDALALQPCNPTMPAARDAIIQADANRYTGANKCLLWRTFASKGLGVDAANHVDSDKVPDGC
ncbi:hypothetical protein L218DRAFT_1001814 [Marasmius fiardii PR-910]|nr:hypothetical protein L218DRAFT_1001814 [Marasmius fiardii PR-910]